MVVFDTSQIRVRRVIEEENKNRFLHETEWGARVYLGDGSVPILYVPRERLPDPLELYSKISDLGNEYGIVKLIVKENDEEEKRKDVNAFLSLHADSIWLKTRAQFFRSFRKQKREILKFYKKLYARHKELNHALNKIPSIDKRTLDLYRLWNCVRLRGGYEKVCRRKLWAQIGRELGYSGRIVSSLSTSLRSAYAKVLLDLEQKPYLLEDEDNDKDNNSDHAIFDISNCKPDIKLIKDLKKFNGFKNNENHCLSSNYLPGYDLTSWLSSLEVFDDSRYDVRNSPIYNLRQYYEKSIEYDDEKFGKLSKEKEINLSDFETEYWQNLSTSPLITEVDTSLELPSVKHNFNLLTCMPSSERANFLKDNWQLDRLPLHKDSLLKFLALDLGEFTHSHIDAGMLFSTKYWSMGPLGMPSLHYNHLGSTKIWYSVPPNQWEKFQALLKKCTSGYLASDQECDNNTENDDDDINFKFSDLYRNFLETFHLEEGEGGARIRNKINGEPVSKGEGNYMNEVILTAEFLQENGIKLNKITQECGSYIFKFPRAYTFNVDSGFCLSESANFAPISWLQDKFWYKIIENDRIFSPLPRIWPLQFLVNVLLNSNDALVIDKCRELLKDPIEEELSNRSHVRDIFTFDTLPIVKNKFNYVSDFSLHPTGASKIVLFNGSDFINLSIWEFLNMVITTESGTRKIFGIAIDDKCLQIQLHLYYEDSFLKGLLDLPNQEVQVHERKFFHIDDLDKLVNVKYANSRIDINCLREISNTYTDGDGLTPLNDALKNAELLRIECITILEKVDEELLHPSPIIINQAKGFRLTDLRSQISKFYDFTILKRLELKIHQCSIEFPERIKFLQLCEEVGQIQSEAELAIKSGDLETLERCLVLNSSIGIKNDSIALTVGKLLWLEVYRDVFENPSHNKYEENPEDYSLESMSGFLVFGIKYCGTNELDKLTKIKFTIVKTQEINSKLNELFRGKKAKSKILIRDIESISRIVAQEKLPLNPLLLKLFKSIMESVVQCKQIMIPIWNLLSPNDRFVEDLKILTKRESIGSLEIFSKFNGGPQDERIQLKDVIEQKIFSKHRKACRHWLTDFSRICLNMGADSAKVKNRLVNCLDLTEDVIGPPESSPNPFYCFCREDDNGATMIECEICKEWYHVKCIEKGNWKFSDDAVFTCSLCSTESGIQDEDTDWIDFNDIQNLILESLDLKLLPDRNIVSDLFLMYDKMLMFKKKMELHLFKENSQLNTSLPLCHVKYFLRKAYGAKCKFGHLNKILKDYCKSQDRPRIEQMIGNGRLLVDRQTEHMKEDRAQLLQPISSEQ